MRILDRSHLPILTALALLAAITAGRLRLFRKISAADMQEIGKLILDPTWEEPPEPTPEN